MMPVPELPLLRMVLRFRVTKTIELPALRGSMWKGALGETLAHQQWRSSDGRSLYGLLLAPSPEDCLLPRAERPPPLVLDMPAQMITSTHGVWQAVATYAEAGEVLSLGVTLVGRAAAEAEAVVQALAEVAATGIGTNDAQSRRGTADLVSVQHVSTQGQILSVALDALDALRPHPPALQIPSTPHMALALAQPLRLEAASSDAGKSLVLPEELDAEYLAAATVRRISNLAAAHVGIDLSLEGLRAKVQGLRFLSTNFSLATQSRYSSSQGRRIPGDGIVGTCVVDLSQHGWLWPYFALAQFVHVGKGAVMGMGALRLLPPEAA